MSAPAPEMAAVDMLGAALSYVEKGLPVFPCNPRDKSPLVPHGFADASADPDQVRAWWTRHPDAMIGVPAGSRTGFWALDIDDPALFERECKIALPATRRCDTGKGYHLLFKCEPGKEVRNRQRTKAKGWPMPELPGAETRGEGGYVIVPPSLHPSGRRYAWHDDAAATLAPASLLSIVRKQEQAPRQSRAETASGDGTDSRYGMAALEAECIAIRDAGNGEQEGTLNAAALKIGALVAGGQLTHDTAREALIDAGLDMTAYDPRRPWTPDGVTKKVDKGLADGAARPRGPQERTIKRTAGGKARSDRETSFDPETGEVEDEPVQPTAGAGLFHGVKLDSFYAYMPMHNYIFGPSGETWPAASVNSRIAPIPLVNRKGEPVLDKKGEQIMQKANEWLDQNRPVEQMTWAPGEPQIVENRLISDGGWMQRRGCSVFNLYRPPVVREGNPSLAERWIEHIERIYPDDADHIIKWLAHRVQRPQEKVNHALVLGGTQGIGKDTFLEPVKTAVGPWNFTEVSPAHMLGRFNGFVKSVVLRVSEARDLGDVDRFAFYDHMKTYTAAPPDVLRVDEKNLREYAVFNLCGVIITTNHKADGLFLPPDDRRHYVAWSDAVREDFTEDYWDGLYGWYASGGSEHVGSYLRTLNLSTFNPKAPPPKTQAFWDIVSSNQAPEEAELADALDAMGWPSALTLDMVATSASEGFSLWLRDRKNSRSVPHKLDRAGYTVIRNIDAKDGLFRINNRRCAVYTKRELNRHDALAAAQNLASFRGRR